jgi:hypothetical protein
VIFDPAASGANPFPFTLPASEIPESKESGQYGASFTFT